MANQRLTDKGTFGTTPIDYRDLLMGVDISDTTSSAEGTSKSLKAQRLITTVTASLSSADVSALNSTPLGLFNPGTGFIVIPQTVICVCTHVGVVEGNGEYLYIGYDKSTSGTTNYWERHRDFYYNESADRTFVFSGNTSVPADGTYAGDISGKALELWSGGAFGGDWTMKVYATVSVAPAI
tara:strand:+ start:22 stop:567 length:546 start_codon:yes stop_codon:yes gene_type:complete